MENINFEIKKNELFVDFREQKIYFEIKKTSKFNFELDKTQKLIYLTLENKKNIFLISNIAATR